MYTLRFRSVARTGDSIVEAAEFDRFADEYHEQHRANVAVTGEAPEYFAEYKIKALSALIQERNLQVDRILDFGSGIGGSTPYIRQYLPQAALTSADVSQRSLDLAQARFAGMAQGMLIEGEAIPAPDNAFDVAFSACVFHHIDHDEHVSWLQELRRVTRPGGIIMVFEHNPLNPLTVRAVRTCPFDENARLLRAGQLRDSYRAAAWEQPQVRYHLFFPRMLAAMRPLERHLAGVPFGAQYSVVATKYN